MHETWINLTLKVFTFNYLWLFFLPIWCFYFIFMMTFSTYTLLKHDIFPYLLRLIWWCSLVAKNSGIPVDSLKIPDSHKHRHNSCAAIKQFQNKATEEFELNHLTHYFRLACSNHDFIQRWNMLNKVCVQYSTIQYILFLAR